MEYKFLDGKIQTRALEYHIVDHCNLKCDHCCSFSPLLKKWEVDLSQFSQDLEKIKKFIQPQFLKIVGGEPLLHPNLVEILKLAKEIKVAPKTSVTTNGHFLQKMKDDFWQNIEMLTVSIYPFPVLSTELLKWAKAKAKENKVEVSWKTQDKFSCLDRSEVTDHDTAKKVFSKCWIRHRCHSIKKARFYCCTRPQYIQKLSSNSATFVEDGVDLYAFPEHELPQILKKHLESTEPLNSCFICHGGHAPLGTHVQLKRKEIQSKSENLKVMCESLKL